MNKLLQTTLITAVLSTGAWAGEDTGALPKTIESGAIVYVNKDISIASERPVTIDNYGSIDTEITASPYPKITGIDMGEYGITTINNHIGRSVKEETDETNAEAIKDANAITDVTLDKVYKIVDEGGGTVNENLELENVKIAEVYDAELKAEDLATYTDKDLLYLGAEGPNRTVRIRGEEDSTKQANLNINFGDQGATNTYALELMGRIAINGNLLNYKNGSITVKQDENTNVSGLFFEGDKKCEIHVPITIESGMLRFFSGADIYNAINVSDTGDAMFYKTSTLKSGAVLRIGNAPTSAE